MASRTTNQQEPGHPGPGHDIHRERPGMEDYKICHIPSARYIDLMRLCPAQMPYIPSSIPTLQDFQKTLRSLGVNAGSHVVLYETAKLLPFAAPRLWWMLKAFGHKKVSVLNGGLKAWQDAGFPVTAEELPAQEGDISLTVDPSLMVTFDELAEIRSKGDTQILDTRPHENYTGKEEEPSTLLKMIMPAVGLDPSALSDIKTGTIPGAKNLPYPLMFGSDLVSVRPVNQLRELFSWASVDLTKPLMTTCYVGYTACMVAMAAYLCGNTKVSVYYGSWVEYGQRASKDQVTLGPQAEVEPPYNIVFPSA
ncbi:thiosulfate sulfurtransferase-like [Liolophura sinensis]|uniref:thiosulfate sulfurtransferase-like n=1 Tax=Liolophura sinensis TaxID=3198878 RepID=UPI0031589F0A